MYLSTPSCTSYRTRLGLFNWPDRYQTTYPQLAAVSVDEVWTHRGDMHRREALPASCAVDDGCLLHRESKLSNPSDLGWRHTIHKYTMPTTTARGFLNRG